MILAIRTDQPQATIQFGDKTKTWLAGRKLSQELLPEIKSLVGDYAKLTGIVVFQGPGSFTGLRIGITVANTLAHGLNIPIVAAEGDDWIKQGASRLTRGDNDGQVMPHYGAEPNITKPSV